MAPFCCELVLDERELIELCDGHEGQQCTGISPCHEVDHIIQGHERPARMRLPNGTGDVLSQDVVLQDELSCQVDGTLDLVSAPEAQCCTACTPGGHKIRRGQHRTVEACHKHDVCGDFCWVLHNGDVSINGGLLGPIHALAGLGRIQRTQQPCPP